MKILYFIFQILDYNRISARVMLVKIENKFLERRTLKTLCGFNNNVIIYTYFHINNFTFSKK